MKKSVRIVLGIVLMMAAIAGIVSTLGDINKEKTANDIQEQTLVDELKSAYNQLEIGMSYDQCVDIIGVDGELFSETENEYFGKSAIYLWKPGDELFIGIEAQFENDKLSSKTWVE